VDRFYCIHVCKATIQEYDSKYFKNPYLFLIFEIFFIEKWQFFFEKWQVFLSKHQIIVVLPKFDQINRFQKFKKDLVKKGLNRQKRDADIRTPGGRDGSYKVLRSEFILTLRQ
jgi:hypothetical protein